MRLERSAPLGSLVNWPDSGSMNKEQQSARGPGDRSTEKRPRRSGLIIPLVVLIVLAGIVVARGGRIATTRAEIPGLLPMAGQSSASAAAADPVTTTDAVDSADQGEIIAIGPVT